MFERTYGDVPDALLHINSKWPEYIVQGNVRRTLDRYGHVTRVYVQYKHTNLDLFKEISGADRLSLQEKLNQLLASWDKKYQTKLDKKAVADGKEEAEEVAFESQLRISELEGVLKHTLTIDDAVDWSSLLSRSVYEPQPFTTPRPKKPELPEPPKFEPAAKTRPPKPDFPEKPKLDKPQLDLPEYEFPSFDEPKVSLFANLLFQGGRIKRNAQEKWRAECDAVKQKTDARIYDLKAAHDRTVAESEALYREQKNIYDNEVKRITDIYEKAVSDWKAERAELIKDAKQTHAAKVAKISEDYEAAVGNWEAKKAAWGTNEQRKVQASIEERDVHNAKIAQLEKDWKSGKPEAVVEHASLVLEKSVYPDWLKLSYRFFYDETGKIGQVEFLLPDPSVVDVPRSARFIASTGEITTTRISKAEQKRLYDSLCYQIALRTVHELFEADVVGNFEAVLFNGIVDQIDPATGKRKETTILSALFERDKFLEVNLEQVEPKACFKSFKGVSATSLIGLAPIAPVMEVSRDDKRFIDERGVAGDMDADLNIAAMDWDDFEHLVREIFEKEFSSHGGEVKVTQSSSDGGVDAVAFDPDPIRGGKIVIQAKRYTNTVGVAAVRDLYGTVLNEGANKGILVTTADYGPDAYKFATDKPLTLLNGSNLLFMLSKHGIAAKIDLIGARKQLGLSNKPIY